MATSSSAITTMKDEVQEKVDERSTCNKPLIRKCCGTSPSSSTA
eukprot:CAMPEP_0204150010 /NCGR_PEP_ID=MMETSP0361-20130328/24899_1 /ASSEMBLY_ACC=CAM_ASM_000343 /TAXON_ID=268821 /ORGANISM="Scrippsiella Hangoei, Strain SHTV-5" /LENGTH=43 /DNA_ID= /DNA_START= /DNA_END= /DNA_ORIENTATION=